MTNLLAAQRPAATPRVLLMAHWDSRPWADEDADPRNRRTPVQGANDGASGVAAVLEMARVLRAHAPRAGIDIALLDGEDLGTEAAPHLFSQGARTLVQSPRVRTPSLVILLDMVGDARLTLPREGRSWQAAPRQIRDLWAIGRAQYPDVWLDQLGPALIDDHVPFIEAGIPAIDVIDFAYPHWHTVNDTPDKCSPASLEATARPILTYLHTLK
jgi:Zn-dependent M28 family amino/carboxypeptidase